MEFVTEQGLRIDGRRPHELRHIKCKLGVFEKPDGSAYVEQGNTKVLAAVYGPHKAHSRKMNLSEVVINCQYSMATFSTIERKNRPRGDRKSMEIKQFLHQAMRSVIRLDMYPRSQIDVFIEVLQADGSNYAVSMNAAMLALIDAGIELHEYAIACTASLTKNNESLVDVTSPEEMSGLPTLTIAALPMSSKIAFMEMSQRLHIDQLPLVMECALAGCREIHKEFDSAVKLHMLATGRACNWGYISSFKYKHKTNIDEKDKAIKS